MKKKLRKNNFRDFSKAPFVFFSALFDRIDVNEDGTIDFNELLVLIAIRNQLGNLEHRLEFVFDLFVFINFNNIEIFLLNLDGMILKMEKLIEKN